MPSRVVLYIASSLDARIAGAGHSLTWLDPHADALTDFAAFRAGLGAAIMGRTTYEISRELAWPYTNLPVHVLTHRVLPPAPTAPADAVIRPYAGALADLVTELRRSVRGDLWLVGGGQLIAQALTADLIDRIHLFIIPAFLASGPHLVPDTPGLIRRYSLTSTRTYSSGVVQIDLQRP